MYKTSTHKVATQYILAQHEDRIALLEQQYVEAGLKDVWETWVKRPIDSLIKRAPQFLDNAVDEVVDDIFRDIAPMVVEEVQKQLIQKTYDEYEQGAYIGAQDSIRGRRPEYKGALKSTCKGNDCDWYVEGYLQGYVSPSVASTKDLRDRKLKREILEAIYKDMEDEVTENVVFTKLKAIWSAINPVNVVKAIIEMVKQYGWKVGVGLALVQIFETFVIPAIATFFGAGPVLAAILSQLPITELAIPVVAARLGIEVGDADVITDDIDEWLENNPNVKL